MLAWCVWPRGTPRPAESVVSAQPKTPADQSQPVPALRVIDLRVKHLVNDGKILKPNGVLGKEIFDARCDDAVTVEAKLSQPAYAYLISFRTDGTEELLFPESENEAPELTDSPRYPSKSVGTSCALTEGAGLEAIVLVATTQSLPAYSMWRKQDRAISLEQVPGDPWGGLVGQWSDGGGGASRQGRRGERRKGGCAFFHLVEERSGRGEGVGGGILGAGEREAMIEGRT